MADVKLVLVNMLLLVHLKKLRRWGLGMSNELHTTRTVDMSFELEFYPSCGMIIIFIALINPISTAYLDVFVPALMK